MLIPLRQNVLVYKGERGGGGVSLNSQLPWFAERRDEWYLLFDALVNCVVLTD